jgi:selT/selW/selH-like putative selenoprotein
MTYDAYREQMTRNRERFEENERTVEFAPEDLAFFKQLAQPLSVVVLAEDWCGDVINNLPVLGRLAEESGKLDLRIFLRDQNLDIMDQYLNQGEHRSIPTFVFYDAAWRELGYWVERPARVNEMQAEMRRELFARDPLLAGIAPDTPFAQLSEEARNRLREANAAFRAQNRALFDGEVVREIRALLEHGIAQSAAPEPQVAVPLTSANGPTPSNGKGPLKVSITYCAECGYEPQTLGLAEALMKAFVYGLASIELIPWRDGAFDVVVGGDLVHSMYRDGGFPEHEAIINAVRQRMAVN